MDEHTLENSKLTALIEENRKLRAWKAEAGIHLQSAASFRAQFGADENDWHVQQIEKLLATKDG